jgi:hypothetical protein
MFRTCPVQDVMAFAVLGGFVRSKQRCLRCCECFNVKVMRIEPALAEPTVVH